MRAGLNAGTAAITPMHLNNQHISLTSQACTCQGTRSPHCIRQVEWGLELGFILLLLVQFVNTLQYLGQLFP